MKALACERHERIPHPVDLLRFRSKEIAPEVGQLPNLPHQSKLVPVYRDEYPSMLY